MPILKRPIDRTIEALKTKTYPSIASALRDNGYSPQSCRAGIVYANLRKRMEKEYTPERIKAKIVKAEKDFTKDKDNSNRSRMIELQAKVCGLTKDNVVAQQFIFEGTELPDITVKPVENNTENT